MAFEQTANPDKFVIGFGHGMFKRGLVRTCLDARDFRDVLRGSDPGHHIFALRIDQEFAIEFFFAGRGIAGKGHTGGRSFPQIAKYHRLHIDRGSPAGRNIMQFTIFDGARIHP